MSAIRLRGATSGTTDVIAAAIAGDGVLSLPSGTGTLATAASVTAAQAAAIAATTFTSSVFLNTTNGYGSTNTMIRRWTNTVRNSGPDITYADTAANGASFTINTTGMYSVHFSDQFNNANSVGLSLNSNQLTTTVSSITVSHILSLAVTSGANFPNVVSFSGYLTVGDVVRPHCTGAASGANTTLTQFSIARVG